MTIKIIGGILIVAGCGGFGLMCVAAHRKEVRLLQNLLVVLNYMDAELQYRMTPLPDLCRQASNQGIGPIKKLFIALSAEMDRHISPNVEACMKIAIESIGDIPQHIRFALFLLGKNLGSFDMDGQLKGIAFVRAFCQETLAALSQNQEVRLRSYQTLALCAGAALVILFI